MKVAIYHGRTLVDVITDEAARDVWQAAESLVRYHAARRGERGGRGWFRAGERLGFERGRFRALLLADSRPGLAAGKRRLIEELSRSISVYTKTGS
jgi:hypothetical protein